MHRNGRIVLGFAVSLILLFVYTMKMKEESDSNIKLDKFEKKAVVSKTNAKISDRSTDASCEPGTPCVYPDQVHLRLIVITFNRASSLLKLLNSLDDLELDGDRAALEIWIDRDKKTGKVDNETVNAAKSFKWSRGPTRVHVQKKHVGIYGQWIDVWRPPHSTGDFDRLISLQSQLSFRRQRKTFLFRLSYQLLLLGDLIAVSNININIHATPMSVRK